MSKMDEQELPLTRRRAFLAGTIATLGLVTSACSPLRTFNTVIPKDGGVQMVARSAPFGSGPRQSLDLYAPSMAAGTKLPIIVFIYGGSWNSGTKAGYSFVGRALAARGFLVAIPDYRLVPEIRYPTFLEDNAAAIRWVIANAAEYGGDSERILLAGHSAGAYNASMLALDPRRLGQDRKAVRGLIGLAGPYDFLPFSGPIITNTFGSAADPATTQPVNYVDTSSPAAFLATGDKDTTVLPKNSDSLEAKLKKAGITVERYRYPDIGHVGLITAISKPFRGKASVLDDMVAFAHRQTK